MAFTESLLPVGNINWLRKLVQDYKNNPQIGSEYVFNTALLGFYDAMWEGLDRTTGHIIYRLSDFIPQEEREKMLVYPSPDGSLICDGNPWDSLEDWRKEWERLTANLGGIPYFQPQLQSGLEELAGIIAPNKE